MLQTLALRPPQRSNNNPESDSDMQYPSPEIKRIVDTIVVFVAKMGPDMEERLKAHSARKEEYCFLNASDRYHPYYQHQLSKSVKEVQYKKQLKIKRMLAQVLDTFPQHDKTSRDSIQLLAVTRPDIFLKTTLQEVYNAVMAKIDTKKVTLDGTTVNQPMSALPRPASPPPLTDEPDPKGQRVRNSILIPEDHFLAQHPGPVRILVSVPNVGGNLKGQVLDITMQALSENICSLKEKIAKEIQHPVSKQKLRGRGALLRDDLSLAHYNIEAGETLSLSLRDFGCRKRYFTSF